MAVQYKKILSFKKRIEEEEAEIERLELQISELSRKINDEPDKNLVEKLL